jgi:hypothetical protein
MPRLAAVDGHCAAVFAAPPYTLLAEESLRGYVTLLSAHFQGFCRDLYTESAQVVASKARPSLRALTQSQFTTALKVDHGNPNLDNLAADFDRFGFNLVRTATAHPQFPGRREHLRQLNQWRNAIAHHSPPPATIPPLTLSLVRDWRASCDGLATHFTAMMYNQLRHVLRRAPW